MFSIPKILVLVLILAVVWFGFKAVMRIKAANEAKAKESDAQE